MSATAEDPTRIPARPVLYDVMVAGTRDLQFDTREDAEEHRQYLLSKTERLRPEDQPTPMFDPDDVKIVEMVIAGYPQCAEAGHYLMREKRLYLCAEHAKKVGDDLSHRSPGADVLCEWHFQRIARNG